MRTLTLTDDGIMIGTKLYHFCDKLTAVTAVTEFAAAHYQGRDPVAVLNQITENQHGARISGQ